MDGMDEGMEGMESPPFDLTRGNGRKLLLMRSFPKIDGRSLRARPMGSTPPAQIYDTLAISLINNLAPALTPNWLILLSMEFCFLRLKETK